MKKMMLALLLVGVLCATALAVLWFAVGPPADAITLSINEHDVRIADLTGWHALFAGFALVLALSVVALVVPLALLLGLALPLAIVIGALLLACATALGIGAIALSPLLLALALGWWLWRRSQRKTRTT